MAHNLPTRLTSRNFDDIKEDMLRSIPELAPEWTNHGDDDYGMAILDIVAGVGDGLHYYIDRLTLENFLRTATLTQSVHRISEMLQYRPKRWWASQGLLRVHVENPLTSSVSIDALSTLQVQNGQFVTLLESISLPSGFTGTVRVEAVQGNRRSHTTEVGESLRIAFPTANVAEQLFTVTTQQGEWHDAYNHPLDSSLDRFYYQERDNEERYWLAFRPSRGRVPTAGTAVTINYLETTGRNLQAGLSVNAPVPGINITTESFEGGRQPETITQIKDRAVAKVYSRDRAVTAQDYSRLAQRVPGIKSVHVVKDPYGVRKVDIYVAGEERSEPTPELLDRLRDFYLERNTVTVDVATWPRVLKPFHLSVEVMPLPSSASSTVLQDVQTRLANYLSYDNLTFSRPIRLSDLYHIIEATPGVDYSNITRLHWADETEGVGNLVATGAEYPDLDNFSVTLITP